MSKSNIVNNAPFSEETLSSKKITLMASDEWYNSSEEDWNYYPEKDVKEFIKKVKNFAPHDSKDIKRLEEYIDKLAGEKLSK